MLDFLSLSLFVAAPDGSLLYQGYYDPLLVGFSIAVPILAAYVALQVAGNVAASATAMARRAWIVVGGLCMGAGIWTMHFVGMLAFSLPCSTGYDPALTLLSMVPGILASLVAFAIISRRSVSWPQLLAGGGLLGGGIGTMHYSGMAAMRLAGMVRYDPGLFALSILVAVLLATLALWVNFRLQSWRRRLAGWAPLLSAVIMGLAVAAMHYTAMAAAYFIRGGEPTGASADVGPGFLAAAVLVVTVALIAATSLATVAVRPHGISLAGGYRWAGLLVAGWLAVAWLGADLYSSHRAASIYRDEVALAQRQAGGAAADIRESLELLKAVPAVLANDVGIRAALAGFGAEVAAAGDDYAARKERWSRDRALAGVDRLLAVAAANFKADVVWMLDAAGDCVAASNAGEAESFVGTNYSDREYFRKARQGQRGQQYAVGRKTRLPGLFYSYPVLDGGRFVGALVVKRNISGFAQATDQFAAFIADANGVIVLAQDKDWEFHTLPGSSFGRLGEAEKLAQYKQAALPGLEVQAGGDPRFPELVRVGARRLPLVLAAAALPDDAIVVYAPRPLGELLRIDGERHWLFALLAIAGSLLIVSVVILQLYLRAVRQGRDAAESANVAKSQFLATMSHEIRTPLNGVLGMAQLLLLPDLTEEERLDYARIILNSGNTLLTLINDILDLSKVEAGKMELVRAVFAPARLMDEIVALFSELAGRKGLVLEARWAGAADACYWGDPTRLRQMLSNLVGNAIKFTEAGSVRIDAGEEAGDGATAVLLFAVTDSGIGIPAEQQKLLFQPFSQVDGSFTRRYSGTGLGLSIVRSLARLMGGEVGVDSEAGRGSRFWLRIGAEPVDAGAERRQGRRGDAAGSAAAPCQPARSDTAGDHASSRSAI